MIYGLDIFYVKANKGDGLKLVKEKGCYMTKNNSKKISKGIRT